MRGSRIARKTFQWAVESARIEDRQHLACFLARHMKYLAASCLIVAMLACLAAGEEAAPSEPAVKKPPPTAQQVKLWVKQLDAESFVVREAATRNLIESSHLAIEPISRVVDQGNPELNWRGVIVLKRLMENPDLDVVEAAETALDRISESPRRSLATMASKALAEQRVHQHPRAASLIKSLGGEVWPMTLSGTETSTQVRLGDKWKGGNKGLRYLRHIYNLRTLHLEKAPVDDNALKYVGRHETLVYLDLKQTQVTDAGLVHLKRLVNLKDLLLANNNVTSDGLVHLKQLTGLETLRLDGTKVTDEGLKHLSGMKNLRGLDLEGTQVTDHGLSYLKNAKLLKWLSLDNTQVTDAGLKHLASLENLRRLYLRNTKVSEAEVAKLLKSRKRLTVLK
jgi:Leucine-rich repeat (LRR) protein